jgi:Transposase
MLSRWRRIYKDKYPTTAPRLSATHNRRDAMTFIGIDIGAEFHVAAAVNDQGMTLRKPFRFTADHLGHATLYAELDRLGPIQLVVLEATGHYWRNLAAALVARGLPVAILNPLQSARFQQETLARTRTDALDALGLARLGQQKRPPPATLPDQDTEQLRELIRHRDRLVQDCGDRVRQLHRLIDLPRVQAARCPAGFRACSDDPASVPDCGGRRLRSLPASCQAAPWATTRCW